MTQTCLHLGQTLWFDGDPFANGIETARHETRGAVLVENGVIHAVGPAADLRSAYPWVEVEDHKDGLIVAGFVDAHAHYPQTGIIASWGKRLIDWLNSYTFPEEMRFGDRAYADEIAGRYLDFLLANGTTSVCSFCTIHPASVDAFFSAAADRNMRVFGGKTCMDRNAPDGLRDTAKSAYDDSRRLLEHWHDCGRASYVITPRFSPTSTPEQLETLGTLWAENPDCLMQTHLSEQTDEIAWVKGLYPQARDYLDTYEAYGLLGEKGLYGHAIHLEDREKDQLKDVGASLIHCPTSNTFIGSGLFDMAGLKSAGQQVGLATDTGGGSSFSMLRSMAAAYEIGQLRGTPLHAAELIWLATAGSARALHQHHRIGNLGAGMEADFIVLDLASTPEIAQRSTRAQEIWEALFPTIMMGDDRAISATYVAGRKVNG
ncbi:guanine deaminase [uncultured Pelagimonas sp.]|uniref:guanine deaminase n=1 Tax=uncultured Pelagimonas sp. TaxID=1618102 RepID=UPI0026199473|nr:guanine deaminase [uncultured Pelagimonas sp.]